MEKKTILSRINSPDDVKNLSLSELPVLAGEIRKRIIDVTHKNGGHLASNLGVVELTLALHRVFNSPEDQIVWDVGHQCYTHKIITGRNDLFETIRKKDGLSGFPKRSESVHDPVETGHASTSISAALGILNGKRIRKEPGKVVAVIGDGAATGGIFFEALNHAGQLKNDLIIIYNDNNMSISRNVGGLSTQSNISRSTSYVSRLTATRGYQSIRDMIDKGLLKIPFFGYRIFQAVMRLKKGVKAVFFKETLFSELGFEYAGPLDGHSITMLIKVLEKVKNLHKPVVVHVVTQKGRGFKLAEDNPVRYHGIGPLTSVDGKIEEKTGLSFTNAFTYALTAQAETRDDIVAVSAAMTEGTGLAAFQEKFPDRLFDVGIAEQHAVTFSAGLAVSGLVPVAAIYSTFMQRAVDQVIHDVALPGLPVVIAMDRSGLVPGDGETHQGVFDIPIFRTVPGIEILAPSAMDEMELMLDYAVNLKAPVILRYPKAECSLSFPGTNSPLARGRGVFVKKNEARILIAATGGLIAEALEASDRLENQGVEADVYNIRFIKPVDSEYLMEIVSGYDSFLFLEEGSGKGGLGEYISSLLRENGVRTEFHHLHVPDHFIPQGTRKELLNYCGLDSSSVYNYIDSMLKVHI
ncbi:MAG: 1-deoxy-D-xylulose-5-phosphate synthase [Spirochaetes bacterium]|nr:MAG: 1-deoxy-D-xylulose-5-phosphate synthase [Spirochaetota bacterium]